MGHSQTEEVTVEYKVLSERVDGEMITQFIEVYLTNAGPSEMHAPGAEIFVADTAGPRDSLGQVFFGNVLPASTVSNTTEISFRQSDENRVRLPQSLLFGLTFSDAAGLQTLVSVFGKKIGP